jgi:DinB superfamily
MNSVAIQFAFEMLRASRKNVINLLKEYSIEEINRIPDGFSNNLVWNLGHLVVTQQLLCYSLAGVPPLVTTEQINAYRKGTKPTEFVDEAAFQELIELSEKCIQQTEIDFQNGILGAFPQPYMTSYGIELASSEKAILFCNAHEGLHYGYCLALRKMI